MCLKKGKIVYTALCVDMVSAFQKTKHVFLLLLPWLLPAQTGVFSLSTGAVVVGATAGNGSVELIASDPAAHWAASSNASWLHLAPSSTNGQGSALIQFSYDSNPNAAEQSGTLAIAGQTLIVNQAGNSAVPLATMTTLIPQGLNLPFGLAVDGSGNVYIADTGHNAIQEWFAATQQVTTLVATGLNGPHGIALDAQGNLYIADAYDNAVKKWAPAQGLITLAPSGLNFPVGVAVDSQGNIYIADFGNNAIKQWNAATPGITTTIVPGLSNPTGVAVDAAGNVYIANFRGNEIDQWNPTNQQLTCLISQGLSFPNAVALDAQGNVYLMDGNNNAIKEWTAATQAVSTLITPGVNGSFGIAADAQGNLYIANTSIGAILKYSSAYLVVPANMREGPQAGTDTVPVEMLGGTLALTATSDQSWLTITSTGGTVIGFAFQANTCITSRIAHITVMGQTMTVTQSGDVPAIVSRSAGDGQSTPVGQVFQNLLQVTVTDANGVPLPGAAVIFSVAAGASGAGGTFSTTPPMPIITDQNGNAAAPLLTSNEIAGPFTVTAGVNGLTTTFSLTNIGYALAGSSALVGSAAGNGSAVLTTTGPWIATSNASWLQIAPGSASGSGSAVIQFSYTANTNPAARTGTLTIAGLTFTVTQVGAAYVPVTAVTTLVSSGLNGPQGVAVDGQGNLYIADTANNVIKQLSAITHRATVIIAGLNSPSAVAVDGNGNLYIADTGNHAIEEFSPASQQLTALVSGLSNPSGVAVDSQGNVYFSDTSNNVIGEWSAANQQVTTLVNSGLSNPTGVAVDGQGNVYFADSGNNTIREWVASSGQVIGLVSSGLNNPTGVAVDGSGNVYVADTGDNAVKEWNAGSRQVSTWGSTGLSGPMGVAVDGQGNLYVADTNDNAVEMLTPAYLALSATSLNEGAQAGTGAVTAQVLPVNTPLTASSDQPWLTITGISGGVIGLSFPYNGTGSSRTAHVAILGLQVTVTQGGDAPVNLAKCGGDAQSTSLGQFYAIALQVCVTDAGGDRLAGWPVMFSVSPGAAGASGTFSATPPMPVITDSNGIAAAPGLIANVIAGTFTVTAGVNGLTTTFSLTNIGYALAGCSALVGSLAGSGSAVLISNGPWIATSNASWLQIAPGSASGSGSAVIQFSYTANTNPAARTGTLTIAGLTFTVTQVGAAYVPVTAVTTLVSSGLNGPQGVAVDGQGNLYIADTANNVIKQLSAITHQATVIIAGLNSPSAVAVDGNGNLYIADTGNHAIEEFSPASQQLTALVSGLSNPSGVALDSQGNVYFSDTSNNVIGEWSAANQQVTTLVNSGLSNPTGVAVDGQGNVYFADSGNNTIREWVASSGQVIGLVSSGLNNPTGVAVDGSGNVYVADTGDNAVKEWNAGSRQVSTWGSTGLSGPMGVAVDGQGNLYVADTNDNAVEMLTPAYLALSATSLNEGAQAGTGAVTAQVLPVNTPLTASSDQPWLTITGISGGVIGLSFPYNGTGSSRTAHVTILGLQVTVTQGGEVAPANLTKCGGDGQSTAAGQPFAAALQVCVTDSGGNAAPGWPVMFSVTPGAAGASGTFSATPPMPVITDANGSAAAPVLTANGTAGTFTVTASVNGLSVTFTLTDLVYTLGATSVIVGNTAGSGSVLLMATGPWTASSNASWLQPLPGSTSGTGNALILFGFGTNTNASAQTGTLTISGLTFTVTQSGASFILSPLVTTIVSSGLKAPQGLAVDSSGNVYIADSSNNAVREWNANTQVVSTLVSTGLNLPTGVAVDAQGNVYIADSKNNAIKEWSLSSKAVTPLVSSGLSSPIGVAVDSQGNVYFSDAGHNAIKEWVAATKQVSTLVSSGLNTPLGVALDAQGNVYFADNKNNAVKEWTAVGKQVSTLVSGLNTPYGVAVDGDGNVYIADTNNNAIKEWNPASRAVTTLISTGLKTPAGVAVDGQGNVYIADTGNSVIKRYVGTYLSLGATSRNEGASAGTDSITYQVIPSSAPVTATSNQTWLTITGNTGGAIGFSFQTNTLAGSRTAQITVMGQTVTITQNAAVPSSLAKCAGDGQSTPVGLAFATALQVCVTDIAGNPLVGWPVTFSVTPGVNGAGGTFSTTPPMPIQTGSGGTAAAPTLTANAIAGTFTVTASLNALTVTFTLTNLGNTLGAASVLFGSGAGSGSVLLMAAGVWTASSNASWLPLSTNSASGTGNAVIQFSYAANTSANARTGTLTISGLTFTVTQAGASFTPASIVGTLVSSGLKAPQGLAVDSSGNVYIADSSNNAIREWNANTQVVSTLVSTGLNLPTGVAVDAQGNVYIADSKNNAIKEWSLSSKAVTPLVSSGLSSPIGVAVDSQGNVYFSDAGHNAIKEWVAATKQVSTLVSSGLNTPLGVALDAQGNVYFADNKNNAVKEWTAVGKQVSTLVSGLNTPYGVAVDGDGNVYIADTNNNAIKEWNPASRAVTTLISTGLKTPAGVAVDGQGNVYIADTGNGVIKRYAPGYLSLGSTSRNESALAGTDSISYQVLPTSLPVTATSNQTWLTITSTNGGAIGFSWSANTSANSRTVQITVVGQIITVSQSGDTPASITKITGNNQTTPVGQVFPTALEVRVKDAAGNAIQGANVTFTVIPGTNGASGKFSASPPMPIATNASGYATAPMLTANSIAGSFTVTASVGTSTTTFTLTN